MANDTSKSFMNDIAAPNTVATPAITPLPLAFTPVTNAVLKPIYVPPSPTFPKDTSQGATTFPHVADTTSNITLAFTPNVLDYYDTQTYHWKLFMVPISAARTGNVLDTTVQTIIAESGVSDLTIDKVEISSVASPSIESGVGTMTTLKFEIVEPAGAGLLDQIYYQSIALGLGSWLTTPYYIQLQFRGRDPDSADSVISGGNTGIGALNWVWPIKLTNSKINVTQVGTTYEFESIFYSETTQSDATFSLLHSTTLSGLTDFASAMTKLEKKLNEDCYEQLIDNYSIPDTYKIIVETKLGATPLVNPKSSKSSSRSSDYKDLSSKSATFPPATSIDSIVNSLLGSTDYFQRQIPDAQAAGAKPKSGEQIKDQMKKLWKIVTETKPIAFDSLRQDYAKAHSIFIFEYDLGVLDADASQSSVDKATQEKRLSEYMSKKILRKRYNYFFTGLNDQIKTLDLNMNFSFAAAVSRFGGIYVDGQSSSKGITKEKNAENEKKAGEIIRDALTKINNAKPDQNVDKIISDAKTAISNTKVSPAVSSRYNTLLENRHNPGQTLAFTQAVQTSGGIAAGGQIGPYDIKTGKYVAQNSGSLALPAKSTSGNLQFISDTDTTSAQAKAIVTNASAISAGKLRPIPYAAAAQESNFNGLESSNNSGRAQTSNMFATALYSGLDASLMQIKLTIKGDPYWLFPRYTSTGTNPLNYMDIPGKNSPQQQQAAIQELKTAHLSYDNSVNLYSTDNFIIIRMRTPKVYNDTTGSTDPYTSVDTFSGVYKVTTITNKFAGGVFLQEIDAILDPVINLAELTELLKKIEDSTKLLEPITPPIISDINPLSVKSVSKLAPGVSAVAPAGKDITGTTQASSITNTFGKTTNTLTSNIPYDTRNTPGKLFLPDGP